ncbi:MAG: HAD family phosphatase [Acidimicrobiales bacterium]|nr:HAD family phosphatase [Acidimicrobiales bacterium]
MGSGATLRAVDAVLYDFGGVFMPSPFAAIRTLSEEQGIEYDDALEVLFGSYHEDTDHPWHRCERGEIPITVARQEIRELGRRRGLDLDLFQILKHLGGNGQPIEPMIDCVRRARAAGCRTAIVTNNVAEAKDLWRPLIPLDELFDAVIDSSEVGIRKPDPRIYELTLDVLGGIEPTRAAFLDDFPGNVVAARKLGMIGILVEADPTPAIRQIDELLG